MLVELVERDEEANAMKALDNDPQLSEGRR